MELKINIIEGRPKNSKGKYVLRKDPMDAVHNPDQRHWIGPKLNLKEYFQNFDELIVESRDYVDFKSSKLSQDGKTLRKLVEADGTHEISDELFQETFECCDIDKFTLHDEMEPVQQFCEVKGKFPKFVPSTTIPTSGTKNLKTLELQQEFKDKAPESDKVKRMRGLRNSNNAYFEACPKTPNRFNRKILDKEILISVRVYRPIKGTVKNVAASMSTANRFVQEIHMLGSNKLSELKDLIKCSGDYIIPGDVSTTAGKSNKKPDTLTSYVNEKSGGQMSKEIYKSAFIFIEDCFYNDMRYPDCKDNSEVIRKWAADPKRQIGPFKTAKMEDTTIEDLTIRLGYPYVYVHQGDHEHLISFVDARLVSVQDVQNPKAYPYERGIGMSHSKICMACNKLIAKWVTRNNDRVPEDPFFFCDVCFHQFNYTPKGEKIGNFIAHTYIDVNAL